MYIYYIYHAWWYMHTYCIYRPISAFLLHISVNNISKKKVCLESLEGRVHNYIQVSIVFRKS